MKRIDTIKKAIEILREIFPQRDYKEICRAIDRFEIDGESGIAVFARFFQHIKKERWKCRIYEFQSYIQKTAEVEEL